jgi:hypothetical protein
MTIHFQSSVIGLSNLTKRVGINNFKLIPMQENLISSSMRHLPNIKPEKQETFETQDGFQLLGLL